jgi:hypothetical protein
MSDLSQLDPTQPPVVEPVAFGDTRIKESRAAVKGSFGFTSGVGTATPEHYLRGFHRFPSGGEGDRPSAGNNGRIFLNLMDQWVELDTGSAFTHLHFVTFWNNWTSSPIPIGGNIFRDIVAINTVVLANSRILPWVFWTVRGSASSGVVAECRLLIDGSGANVFPSSWRQLQPTSDGVPISACGFFIHQPFLSEGVHEVKLQLLSAGPFGSMDCTQSTIVVFVV